MYLNDAKITLVGIFRIQVKNQINAESNTHAYTYTHTNKKLHKYKSAIHLLIVFYFICGAFVFSLLWHNLFQVTMFLITTNNKITSDESLHMSVR